MNITLWTIAISMLAIPIAFSIYSLVYLIMVLRRK